MVKNPPAKAGDVTDVGSIPGSGRSPGGGNGNALQYSCLKDPVVHGVTECQTQLRRLSKQMHPGDI